MWFAFQVDHSAGPSHRSGRQRSSSHMSQRDSNAPGTSNRAVPLARENEAFEMDVEADYNIAPPSYDEARLYVLDISRCTSELLNGRKPTARIGIEIETHYHLIPE